MRFLIKTLDSAGEVDETFTFEDDISPRQVEILRERLSEGLEIKGDEYEISHQGYRINSAGNPSFTVYVKKLGV